MVTLNQAVQNSVINILPRVSPLTVIIITTTTQQDQFKIRFLPSLSIPVYFITVTGGKLLNISKAIEHCASQNMRLPSGALMVDGGKEEPVWINIKRKTKKEWVADGNMPDPGEYSVQKN